MRHYDDVGLLVPADVDPSPGYRRYGRDQVRLARLIRSLRWIDLPIEEIPADRAADGRAARRGHSGRPPPQAGQATRPAHCYPCRSRSTRTRSTCTMT
ncbi:MAG TPA: MerR family transcriptional regulator [Pseudonocardiaceae bacterium]|nr:MerR family transcriptional regulator [Pseudonocardiaceae bacterium]